MKIKCLIIEDEPLARKILKEYIDEMDFLELSASAENPLEALQYLDAADLIFLDIEMPKISGMEFLRMKRNLSPVVITTAFPEYAVESYQLDVLDYLLKPITFDRFLKAATKAKEYLEFTSQKKEGLQKISPFIYLKVNNKLEKITFSDILFIEGKSNYVMVYTNKGKLLTYSSLNLLLQNLPATEFLQIHKSYIISIKGIEKADNSNIYIEGHQLPVSKTYKKRVTEIIQEKMLKK